MRYSVVFSYIHVVFFLIELWKQSDSIIMNMTSRWCITTAWLVNHVYTQWQLLLSCNFMSYSLSHFVYVYFSVVKFVCLWNLLLRFLSPHFIIIIVFLFLWMFICYYFSSFGCCLVFVL